MIKRRVGLLGAFAYSGSNFTLAFVLQQSVSDAQFGAYAFALVCVQMGQSVSNALFASPIVVALIEEASRKKTVIADFWHANIVFCTISAMILAGVLILLGVASTIIGLFVAQAFLFWMRWFLRAIELAHKQFVSAALADVAYGITTVMVGILLFYFQSISIENALCAMLCGTVVSLFIVRKSAISGFGGRIDIRHSLYWSAFTKNGRWALAGVITTEIMANLHSYVITIFLGPAAFAPVAIVSLFFRPIPILTQALTQYERPLMAEAYAEHKKDRLKSLVASMRSILNVTLLGNLSIIVCIISFVPQLLGDGQYETQYLLGIMALVAIGQFVRIQRAASSAALQGAGDYRLLAFAMLIVTEN